MIVELGLKALHEPGVIRGRRQLRKHGIAWIMGGVKGDIVGGAVGNPIKGEGEPFRSLCAQVKLSDLVVVITALSRFFLYIYTGGEASSWTGVSGLQNVGSIPTYRLPLLFFKTSANDFWVVYNITIQEARKHGT